MFQGDMYIHYTYKQNTPILKKENEPFKEKEMAK